MTRLVVLSPETLTFSLLLVLAAGAGVALATGTGMGVGFVVDVVLPEFRLLLAVAVDTLR